MNGKATKAEVAARVEAVFELRLGGAGFTDIREYAIAPTDRQGQKLPPWGVSDSQLWRYIRAADKLCKERADARADHRLARHLIRRERLYAHCLEVGDFKGALAVLKDEAMLEGLYEATAPATPTAAAADQPPMTPAEVVKLLSGQVRQLEAAPLPAGEKARLLTGLSGGLLAAFGVDALERRLTELERLAERKGAGP